MGHIKVTSKSNRKCSVIEDQIVVNKQATKEECGQKVQYRKKVSDRNTLNRNRKCRIVSDNFMCGTLVPSENRKYRVVANEITLNNNCESNVHFSTQEFIQQYKILLPKGLVSSKEDVGAFLEQLDLNTENYQIGITKVQCKNLAIFSIILS